jgi:hypothetical protein
VGRDAGGSASVRRGTAPRRRGAPGEGQGVCPSAHSPQVVVDDGLAWMSAMPWPRILLRIVTAIRHAPLQVPHPRPLPRQTAAGGGENSTARGGLLARDEGARASDEVLPLPRGAGAGGRWVGALRRCTQLAVMRELSQLQPPPGFLGEVGELREPGGGAAGCLPIRAETIRAEPSRRPPAVLPSPRAVCAGRGRGRGASARGTPL